ncbi:MAG: DUF4339 domain-containing protein [Planctomycetota bacterium]
MQEWYVHQNGNTTGPFTTDVLKESIKAGKVTTDATFCVTGTTTFRTLAEFPELKPAAPTELPIACAPKSKCGACSCPIARALVKLLILATLIAGGAFAAKKLGFCCKKPSPVIKPL